MSTLKKIEMLGYQLEIDEGRRLWDIVGGFWQYVISLFGYDLRELLMNEEEKEKERKKIDEEYEKCLEGLKELNEMSKKAFGRKIYKKSYTRCDVESFFFELYKEKCEDKIEDRI